MRWYVKGPIVLLTVLLGLEVCHLGLLNSDLLLRSLGFVLVVTGAVFLLFKPAPGFEAPSPPLLINDPERAGLLA